MENLDNIRKQIVIQTENISLKTIKMVPVADVNIRFDMSAATSDSDFWGDYSQTTRYVFTCSNEYSKNHMTKTRLIVEEYTCETEGRICIYAFGH